MHSMLQRNASMPLPIRLQPTKIKSTSPASIYSIYRHLICPAICDAGGGAGTASPQPEARPPHSIHHSIA